MKKSLKILAGILVAILLMLLATSVYMLDYSLSSQRENWTEKQAWENLYAHYPFAKEWFDSIRHDGVLRDTFMTNSDGVRLHAFYLPRKGAERTAVLVHGYGNRAIDMFQLGYMYHHHLNSNILLPDLYGHGESGGESIRMGWLDRLDVKAWSKMAENLFHAPIVVHGISMGAATTMMLSGEEDIPESITHFIEDCGYTSVRDEFSGELKVRFGLPSFPLLDISSLLCKAVFGWSFSEASSLKQVARCKRPMFFIHGDADSFVPTEMVFPLYFAHSGRKEIWITKGVQHAVSYECYPSEYTLRVRRFLEK